jgi:ElaB/YqjD/DUF883 family membrane-anchored ribosome-binding protein
MKNNPQTGAGSRNEKAADMTEKVAAQVESTVSDLADRGREASRSVRDVADNFGTALDRSLERQPMTTLAMAVAVGFVLGALWKA